MANQLAFYFDASACTACKACMAACKDRSDLPVGVNWRNVVEYGGGSWIPHNDHKTLMVPANVFAYALSIACMHCANPLCADVCPAKAISKRDDGVVLIDADACIGCRYCEWACPYNAPQFHEELDVMTKCDFCLDLQAQGMNPACVDACVMRCLNFGDINELRANFGNLDAIEPLPSSDITSPAIVITPHKHAQFSGEGTGRIIGPKEL